MLRPRVSNQEAPGKAEFQIGNSHRIASLKQFGSSEVSHSSWPDSGCREQQNALASKSLQPAARLAPTILRQRAIPAPKKPRISDAATAPLPAKPAAQNATPPRKWSSPDCRACRRPWEIVPVQLHFSLPAEPPAADWAGA